MRFTLAETLEILKLGRSQKRMFQAIVERAKKRDTGANVLRSRARRKA